MSYLAKELIKWHKLHGRKNLPWQKTTNPYHIWLSEIMLQQTQVLTVHKYFEKFINTFPDISSLARAEQDQVMELWSGLGYYHRARNLYDAANIILLNHNGFFPKSFDEIIKLPGIGRSTAGAICAFSFSQNYPILDGNVKRVFCRFFGIKEWPGKSNIEKKLWCIAEKNLPNKKVNIYTQAIMDLGATVCVRSNPNCNKCPISKKCLSYRNNWIDIIPASKPKKILPLRKKNVVILEQAKNILLRKRREKAVWEGLWSLPEFNSKEDLKDWLEKKFKIKNFVVEKEGKKLAFFSHYKLEMTYQIIKINVKKINQKIDGTIWIDYNNIETAAIPSPIKNLIKQVYNV